MENYRTVQELLQEIRKDFHPVVPFNVQTDHFLLLDLTANNPSLNEQVFSDTGLFSEYISRLIKTTGAKYAIGGYAELRIVYSRSARFDATTGGGEPRRLHLGTDIWGKEGTPVFCPFEGKIHSTAMNASDGDYGATLILQHETGGLIFHTLYGHMSAADIHRQPGATVRKGEHFCSFGTPAENGNWPPHLHFQVIIDMGNHNGDYPGVCSNTDRNEYLQNCPDPDFILNMNQLIR